MSDKEQSCDRKELRGMRGLYLRLLSLRLNQTFNHKS